MRPRRFRLVHALACALVGTLTAAPAFAQVIAVDDTYDILEGQNLNDPAPGLLANDLGAPIEAEKVTDPASGTATVGTDGSLSYVPAAGFAGQASFVYLARDFIGNVSNATVTINVNGIPDASPDNYSTNEDTALNVNAANGVLANDTDDQPSNQLTAELVADVSDGTLTLNPNGSFAYTPDAEFSGSDSFTYRAVDSGTPQGQSAVVTVTIDVNAVNDPPVATADSYSTAEEATLNVNAGSGVLANDDDPVEGDDLTAQLVSDVSSGSLTLNADGSFTYTPVLNFFGSDSFTYRAVDDGSPAPALSAITTVTIDVTEVNDPPVAVDDSYATDEDTPLSVNAASGLLANDSDVDDPSLQVLNPASLAALVDDATEGTLNVNANGSLTFTPVAGFSGTVTFDYQATDGTDPSNMATVTITVAPVNDPPVAMPDAYTTDEDVPLNVNAANGVLANDTDDEMDALTAQLVAGTTNGALTLNPNRSFNDTPNADFFGSDSFTYRPVDDGDPAPAQSPVTTVTITVNAVNDPPVAVNDAYATDEDTSLNVATNQGLLINDSDPDPGDVLSVQLVDDVANGTLVLNAANGTFSYTPAMDFNGTDTFTYVVSDDAGPPGGPLQSAEATVTITINPVNDAPRPVAVDPDPPIPDQSTTENVPLEPPLDLAPFFFDPEGDEMSFTITSGLPAGLVQTPPLSTISGTPLLGSTRACVLATGEGYVEVIVSDGLNDADPVTFCLRVIEAGRTDLSLGVDASPSPARINESVTWTFTIDNLSVEAVPTAAVDAQFYGQMPFTFASPPNCTDTSQAKSSAVRCTGGPVPAEGSATITVTGSSSQAGDVAVMATVEVDGPIPVETDETNNSASGALNIAEELAPVPAQSIAVTDHRAGAAGDFNGDGFVDLAVATSNAFSTRVYQNVVDPTDPNAAKRALSVDPLSLGDQAPSSSIVAADLDRDGALDLVTANRAGQANGIFMNTNAGDGSFGFTPSPDALGDPMEVSNAVTVGDLNGDSLPDIVFANSSPNPVYLNQGGGVFMPTADTTLGDDDSVDVVVANLFGDALPEVVFANRADPTVNPSGDATVYSFDGGAWVRSTIPTGPTTSVAAGDLEGDGRIDLVFGRAEATSGLPSNPVYLNTSTGATGQFSVAAQLGGSPTNDVLVVDPDDDGDLDVIAINATGGQQIFVNNGNGAFTLNRQQFVNADGRFAVADNFSVDDRIDVAVISPSGIDVYYNDGAGNIGAGDTNIPVLTLLGQSRIELTVEADYQDAGASAVDPTDGDITDRIVVDNPVDTAVLGTYTVTYTVTDRSGNAAVPVTREVVVGARTGTGGGGGGAFGLGLALFLATLGAVRHPGRARPYWSAR